MANPYHHAVSSAKTYGGDWLLYMPVHQFFDQSKAITYNVRHRALYHHAEGCFQAERTLGPVVQLANGKNIPTRWIAEQHCREDFRFIPTVEQWMNEIEFQPTWMRIIEQPGAHYFADAYMMNNGCFYGSHEEGVQHYLPVMEWMWAPFRLTHDPRIGFLRWHTEGIFQASELFPDSYDAARFFVTSLYGHVPSAMNWLNCIAEKPWMGRNARKLSEEQETYA